MLPVDGVGAGAGGGGGGDEAVEVSASGMVVVDIGMTVKSRSLFPFKEDKKWFRKK